MSAASEELVLAQLGAIGLPFDLIDCDPELADTAAFCEHYGVPLSHSCNLLVVKSRRGGERFGACLVRADSKLSNRALRRLLETSKASFASAEETCAMTGMMIGGVSAFGLPADMPLWMEARIRELDYVVVGGGSRSVKVRCGPDLLARLPNASWVEDLAEPLLQGAGS
ncbi:MAG: YbaK/EbsC family protein [Myxococcota bacterium]|nr:YbaK/EbsC family protein [Myxococcota bacterium]